MIIWALLILAQRGWKSWNASWWSMTVKAHKHWGEVQHSLEGKWRVFSCIPWASPQRYEWTVNEIWCGHPEEYSISSSKKRISRIIVSNKHFILFWNLFHERWATDSWSLDDQKAQLSCDSLQWMRFQDQTTPFLASVMLRTRFLTETITIRWGDLTDTSPKALHY